MTYIIIRFSDYDLDSVIATREWLSTEKGWQWFIENNNQIEWVSLANPVLQGIEEYGEITMTYVIIRIFDGSANDDVITTREWLSTEKGWQWFIKNNHHIEWVQEAQNLANTRWIKLIYRQPVEAK